MWPDRMKVTIRPAAPRVKQTRPCGHVSRGRLLSISMRARFRRTACTSAKGPRPVATRTRREGVRGGMAAWRTHAPTAIGEAISSRI